MRERRLFALAARLRLQCSGAAAFLGSVPLLGALLRRLAGRLVPRGTLTWTKVREGLADGLWIQLDARSAADMRRGDREPAVQDALKQWLAPGKVFYDVGANTGYFCLVASRLVGPSGKIYAFEAETDVSLRLQNTAERNNLPNLSIVEAAVWSETGTVTFDRGLGSPDRMVGHVVDQGGSVRSDCVVVPAITLDGFARTAPAPDVVKCDVEGAELEVLRGALGLLRDKKPVVICEVHSSENLRELRPFFQKLGYQVKMLEPEGEFPVHILAIADL
jgi:FkbM family methyltransferase